VKFSKEEKKEYTVLENSARSFYENFVLNGKDIGTSYLKLSQKLTPLRVACAGGKVPLEDTAVVEDNEEMDSDEDEPKKGKKVQQFSDFAFTSKLKTLIEELQSVRTKDKTSKCLVFSQYSSFLMFLQSELPKHGFQYRTLSGDMSMRKRAKALQDFQHDPPTTIFLLSMRAGAVGINLTQANNVFFMEPCLNPVSSLFCHCVVFLLCSRPSHPSPPAILDANRRLKPKPLVGWVFVLVQMMYRLEISLVSSLISFLVL